MVMRRRQFITSASATVAAASIAGCSGILGGDGGSSGPESPVKDYFSAIDSNDPEALNETIHPDSPNSGGQTPSESDLEAIDASVTSTEVTEGPENGEAVVEAEVELTVSMMGQEQTQTDTVTYEVRKHEGDWKLYQER